MCLATILMQLLCYKKGIEFKETIFFTISLFLIIVLISVTEFFELSGRELGKFWEFVSYIFYLMLAITTPWNVHTERLVSKVAFRNRVIFIVSILAAINLIFSYFFHYERTAETMILIFMIASVVYSMLVITRSKPSLLVMHREKIEKRTSKILMFALPPYAILVIADYYYNFINGSLLDGSIVLPLIVTSLSLSKIIDDFKRLTLFRPDNSYHEETLASYKITSRESEVLELLIKGDSYKTIGEKLFISLPTVKTHVSNIYQKMNINNKVELINLLHK
jgi:DNA-binding CsgD family transcriptional regulator